MKRSKINRKYLLATHISLIIVGLLIQRAIGENSVILGLVIAIGLNLVGAFNSLAHE